MITFGGYDVDRFAYNQTVTWNDVTNTAYWTIDLKKAQIGDTMVVKSTSNAILDSGTSFIAMPDKELKSLVSLLGSVYSFDCEYYDDDELYACACPDINVWKDTFPPLRVTLGESNTYEIPYDEYSERLNGLCYLTIMSLGE